MIIAMAGVGTYYWYNNTYFVSTEDATVSSDLVKAGPQISGKLLELYVDEGQHVEKGQIIARQDMGTLSDTSVEMSIVRAPITGTVIKKQGTVGEIVSPGQSLAIMIDPSAIYINANVEETKLEKLKIGQPVDIAVDEYGGNKLTGKVQSIGEATAATFSLLPTSSGGTFTKVTQKVPVKIKLDKYNVKLQPGISVVVKIHVK
ncbi:HlyD family efflux transporter periplasmic adaptor subunit [Clostridium sp. OS1-26]|uniref:HlyD family secretion protein n=1 Tax=Clostridium sp. OS1-26 TaxID=3070681 RepID=UPI0027DF72A7|nr:HlyD family efflux transporter periplasmic adaptor subunit [Clostridium sp. OS1-26]WML37251.1 efflux RND transporter periplasmic adaptor subunit [Clostridium sp. OS1-26]